MRLIYAGGLVDCNRTDQKNRTYPHDLPCTDHRARSLTLADNLWPKPKAKERSNATPHRPHTLKRLPLSNQQGSAAKPSPNCPNITESTYHFLFFCHKYTTQRHKLLLTVQCKGYSKLKFIVSDGTAIHHAINYINDTGRFKHM